MLDHKPARSGNHTKVLFDCDRLREASQIDFVHEKRHMDVLLEIPPPPPLETSRTFFDFARVSGALFILQSLRLSVVSGPDNEHTYILKI